MTVFFVSSVSTQTMFIRQKGGVQVSYDVNNINKMNFSTGNLNIVKADKSIDVYALTNLQYVNFGEFQTAINPIHSFKQELCVFPNPVIDILTIKNISSDCSTIAITSVEGKQMLLKQINSFGNAGIDVSRLPQGFYLCKLYNGTDVLTTKFLKQ